MAEERLQLVIDVGNSRFKLGLFEPCAAAATLTNLPCCLKSLAFRLGEEIDWTQLTAWLTDRFQVAEEELPERLLLSATVAGANPVGIDRVLHSWPFSAWEPPRVIGDARCFPLAVDVEAPNQVGIDRLLNAVAANVVRPADHSVIIVDSGTATTVDFLTATGAFAGGAILPGFGMTARALHQYTALLPLITIHDLGPEDLAAIGTDTKTALQSGLLWGHVGAVKELIRRFQLEVEPAGNHPLVFVTGGAGRLLANHLGDDVRWEPFLSLQGLAMVAADCR